MDNKAQWNLISEVGIPEYKDVLYKHSCGTKGIGKLVTLEGEVRAISERGQLRENYGYAITAWYEIPN